MIYDQFILLDYNEWTYGELILDQNSYNEILNEYEPNNQNSI